MVVNLLPEGYTASHKYPLVLRLHQLDMGDWPEGLLKEGLLKEVNPWFNATQRRRAYLAIVIAPLLGQKTNLSGKTINFGGVSPVDQPGSADVRLLGGGFLETDEPLPGLRDVGIEVITPHA